MKRLQNFDCCDMQANSSSNVLSTTIGIFTGVRILDREDYNFCWQTEEMEIIIHTSYPPPISARISAFHYTITLWFPCLDGLIQTRGNVARVKKSARNTSRRRVILRAFLNSSNIPKCLDQAIQTRRL